MDEKKNAVFTISLLATILLLFTIADLVDGERIYSEMENRMLARKPKFSKESLLSGEYSEDYEEYVSDQFVSRDKWVEIKTRLDILLQKKDINGVYLGADNYLIEQHLPEDYTEQMEQDKVAMLKKLVDEWDAQVMLVPTADNILTDKLPAYADYYDETRLLELVRASVGTDHYVDVYHALEDHREEEIYYRTDHHWTTLGAYYGYLAWTETTGQRARLYNMENMTTVSDDFQGTLHSRVPVVRTTDPIQVLPMVSSELHVTYDQQTTADTLFEEKYLSTKNQYGYFLDDNHAIVEIQTRYVTGGTLFVIKDSYANCLIPLLVPHYGKIYVVDPRYYNGSLSALMESVESEKGMDVLVLYNCVHFLEEFRY
ncbi:MAG: hypothetical protein J1E64_10395 [Acetatifactor sp.]|nr:hypothetical protein [Acetatifactor sp.]